MERFSVTPMTPADYVDATDGRVPRDWEPNAWEAACARLDQGPAWTARVDGDIAAVGGLLRLWPGVAAAWLSLTPVAFRAPHALTRHLGRVLARQIACEALHRVQADVRDGDVLALRLLVGDRATRSGAWRGLGFKEESCMEAYGMDRTDYIRCVRITP